MYLKFWYLVSFRRYEHLKFASHFANFWRQFLSDFDVRPCKSKLMTSSSRIWKNFVTRGPISYLKTAKTCQNRRFGTFLVPYRPPSGNFCSDSCRGGPKLQNEYSNIKIGQVLSSEMRKKWYNHENMLKLKTSPNHSKSLILGSRDSFPSNFNIFEKINSNCLTLQAVTCKFLEMCPVFAPVIFFSFWHYIPLDNHWSDHSYYFWPPNPTTRRAVAHRKKFTISWFTTKP